MVSSAATLAEVAAVMAGRQTVQHVGPNVAISDVHMDSRRVTPGSLYVAIRGSRADGHDFIEAAVRAGAVAVALEEPRNAGVPVLVVEDTRAALGWMAAEVHRYPARHLGMVGITGTNGKTTVAHMLAAMSAGTKRKTAVIGTVSANVPPDAVSPRTTPEASDLQRLLRGLVAAGEITDVALEVSSHAMDMGRVNGVEFETVAFTNLSQDHLDYHLTMENYYQAKAQLFGQEWAQWAVIWIDDPWGARLAGETALTTTTVGTGGSADVRVTFGEEHHTGCRFEIILGSKPVQVSIPLAGRFNAVNAAIALTIGHLQGFDLEHSIAHLATMQPIPGRYNSVPNAGDLWVVVDYAHTPDAIESIIAETRLTLPGRIIAVAGAGGDRDQEKRPLMGRALGTADVAIITTDNPRSEDPGAIIDQVVAGLETPGAAIVVPDRSEAIAQAIAQAQPGDAVLILGKGHETTQEYADHVVDFDDSAVARAELEERFGGSR